MPPAAPDDTKFSQETAHFSRAREITGNKLALTCVKKGLVVYLYTSIQYTVYSTVL
jgi:hypothetical protein